LHVEYFCVCKVCETPSHEYTKYLPKHDAAQDETEDKNLPESFFDRDSYEEDSAHSAICKVEDQEYRR